MVWRLYVFALVFWDVWSGCLGLCGLLTASYCFWFGVRRVTLTEGIEC